MNLPWQVKVGTVAGLCLAFAAWLHVHDAAIHRADALAQRTAVDRAHAQRTMDTLRIVDTLMRWKSDTVTRTLARVDTMWKEIPETLHTKADTERAIAALPQLRLSTDSAIRACTEFQSAFSQYRTACDSALAAKDGVYNDLKAKYDAEHPGWKGTAKEWVVRLLIGTAAYEAGKHLP